MLKNTSFETIIYLQSRKQSSGIQQPANHRKLSENNHFPVARLHQLRRRVLFRQGKTL